MHNVIKQDVIVRVIPPESAYLDFVEFSFKDEYISRADMWRFLLYYILLIYL